MSYTCEEQEEKFLEHFDNIGKKEIKETREKYLKEQEQLNKTYKGRQEIKKELIRIKETGPKKTLDMMMKFAMKVNELKMFCDNNCVLDDTFGSIIDMCEELENMVANPDNDDNLFSCFTELMSVCDESEITKKVNITKTEKKFKNLTEAQKIAYCKDPDNKDYTMCPKCMRCMTTKHYRSHHQGTDVCRKVVNTKMATLHSGAMYNSSQGDAYVKVTSGVSKEFNKISNSIDWGETKKITIKEEED